MRTLLLRSVRRIHCSPSWAVRALSTPALGNGGFRDHYGGQQAGNSFWRPDIRAPSSQPISPDRTIQDLKAQIAAKGGSHAIHILEQYPCEHEPKLQIGIECMQAYLESLGSDKQVARKQLEEDDAGRRLIWWTWRDDVREQIESNIDPFR